MRLTDEQLAVWQQDATRLAEELTRLYAIERAARSYVESTDKADQEWNEHGYTDLYLSLHIDELDAEMGLRETVGEVTFDAKH